MADAYATATATLLKMAGEDQTHADRALAAGAQRIDEAFSAGGYTTPLDLGSLPEGEAKTRLTKMLEYANLAIAAWVLSTPVDAKQGTSSKVNFALAGLPRYPALDADLFRQKVDEAVRSHAGG